VACLFLSSSQPVTRARTKQKTANHGAEIVHPPISRLHRACRLLYLFCARGRTKFESIKSVESSSRGAAQRRAQQPDAKQLRTQGTPVEPRRSPITGQPRRRPTSTVAWLETRGGVVMSSSRLIDPLTLTPSTRPPVVRAAAVARSIRPLLAVAWTCFSCCLRLLPRHVCMVRLRPPTRAARLCCIEGARLPCI
jgi:hypothetical protein